MRQMIKALLLIFEPINAWDRAVERRLGFSIFVYLLPMLLIVGFAEGYGLVEWGRFQSPVIGVKKFTPEEAMLSEIVQLTLMVLIMGVCTYLIKALGETFHGKHNYTQAATVVIYGLSPLFLLRLLDVLPEINLWIPWALGILLTVKILYHGVPRVMQPDPPHAFGLFFMSALLIALVTGAERFVMIGYLTGKYRPIGDVIHQIGHRLHVVQ